MTKETFNIQYKGVWLAVDANKGISKLDNTYWVDTQDVWHGGEKITEILDPLTFLQIEKIIKEELNN
jgi:hypothetical protein